jgi:hypothetical protein
MVEAPTREQATKVADNLAASVRAALTP